MVSKAYKLKQAYIGEGEILNWTLYTETNFKNSSYGGFRTMGWYTSSTPSYIAFDTSGGYIYGTNSHSQVKLSPQVGDLSLFQNAKAIKLVFDGIWVPLNSNTYATKSDVAGFGLDSRQSNFTVSSIASWEEGSGTFSPSTWYSGYSIIYNGDEAWKVYLDNGYVGISNTGWGWNNILTSSNWFNSSASDSRGRCAKLSTDQTNNGYAKMKDVHLYLAN